MDNDNIQDIFDDFHPELSPECSFISRLEEKLNGVELIRERQRTIARGNRRALIVSASVGFAVGVVFALLMPYLGTIASNMRAAAGNNTALLLFLDNYRLTVCLIICATSVFTALNAYELTLALQRRRLTHPDIP